MITKKYRSIMEKSEEHREKWALGLTVFFTAVIFFSWTLYKGYIDLGGSGTVVVKEEPKALVATAAAPGPIENSKSTLRNAFDEFAKQYSDFKESVSSVIVPFITGIEVYESRK
jgi:hypothetical protein